MLEPFVKDDLPAEEFGETLSVEAFAKRLGVSKQRVCEWLDAKLLIGWSGTCGSMEIPAEQISESRGILLGIDRVLSVIPNPRMAWRFLYEESPFLERPERPIDVLKRGEIEEVLYAARASGEDFS